MHDEVTSGKNGMTA